MTHQENWDNVWLVDPKFSVTRGGNFHGYIQQNLEFWLAIASISSMCFVGKRLGE